MRVMTTLADKLLGTLVKRSTARAADCRLRCCTDIGRAPCVATQICCPNPDGTWTCDECTPI